MVQVLLGPERKVKKRAKGKARFSFASTSPLALPPTCPTVIFKGFAPMNVAEDTDDDEDLSKMFSESGFDIKAGIKDGGCYIDAHSLFTSYAIGARVDLLERRCGAGFYLLNLVRSCPIKLWTPSYLYDHAKEEFDLDFTKCTSRWLWEDEPTATRQAMSKHLLPPNLRKLCTDVEEVVDEARLMSDLGVTPDDYSDEWYDLPSIHLAWWDNVQWRNKQVLKNPTFTAEKGTNPVFALMDSYAEISWQSGATHMGSPIYHNLDDVRRIVELAKPYSKLIKYLSHNATDCGFRCY